MLPCEMFPSVLWQGPDSAILAQNLYCRGVIFAVPDLTDLSDRHSGDSRRNLGVFTRCEKEFVIFSAVQRQLEIGVPGARNLVGDQKSGPSTCCANMG